MPKTKDAFAFRQFYESFPNEDVKFQEDFFYKGFNETRINSGIDRIGSIEQSIREYEYCFKRTLFLLDRIKYHNKRLEKFISTCDRFSKNWQRAIEMQSRYDILKSSIQKTSNIVKKLSHDWRKDCLRVAFNEELGVKLRLARRRKGIKQDAVAKFLGIKKATYSHYETGRREIPPVFLYQLIKLFEIPADWLFG